ncbi:tetratricopeptide repeat protein [Collimonas sp. PA-H2]|uniref:tetratricopeptide repeat protein n=1 Tax=Collimonas sp. PA-H2 TaxID=1881062 RepID=UPI000C01132D|nr:tetratricopeptide repeat protein [Collimonas sp. PA-H2]PFH10459.1 tetratricopeptide repeat protein [Collimonas sp. PA-H2]
MKKALAIVTLSTLLSACASVTPSNNDATSADVQPAASPAASQATSAAASPEQLKARKLATRAMPVKPPEEHLPAVPLTKEILFKVLSSEIAFQRGNWQSAYVTLLGAAQQTRDPRLARRAAEMALSAKQAAEALVAIRLWRELAPDSEEATQYYLGFIMLSNNLAEARPILEKRLLDAPPQARGVMMLQIQRLLMRAQDKTGAFALLEQLVAPYTAMAEAHLALAQEAFSIGNATRAKEEAQIALNLKPDSELGILTSAQVAADSKEVERILTDFLKKYPGSREVRVAYARTLIDQKQYEKARSQFEILLKSDKQDATTLLALGLLNAQIGDTLAAERYLTSYLDQLAKHPDEARDSTQALLILAQIAADRNDTDSALKWLSQVEPGDAYLDAQLRRAQLLSKRGDLDGARRVLAEIDTNGEREKTQVTQVEAQLLREANHPQEAFKVLETALKAQPDNADLLYDYAMMAEKLDNLSTMESALRKLIAIAPENQQAYNALGYSLAERNIRLPEALVLIQKALTLAPQDPFIVDSMGWVQYRLGNLDEAETRLRTAYGLLPDPEIAVHLGEVLWVKGQKTDAQKLWREVRQKDPQNDALKNTLARLRANL